MKKSVPAIVLWQPRLLKNRSRLFKEGGSDGGSAFERVFLEGKTGIRGGSGDALTGFAGIFCYLLASGEVPE